MLQLGNLKAELEKNDLVPEGTDSTTSFTDAVKNAVNTASDKFSAVGGFVYDIVKKGKQQLDEGNEALEQFIESPSIGSFVDWITTPLQMTKAMAFGEGDNPDIKEWFEAANSYEQNAAEKLWGLGALAAGYLINPEITKHYIEQSKYDEVEATKNELDKYFKEKYDVGVDMVRIAARKGQLQITPEEWQKIFKYENELYKLGDLKHYKDEIKMLDKGAEEYVELHNKIGKKLEDLKIDNETKSKLTELLATEYFKSKKILEGSENEQFLDNYWNTYIDKLKEKAILYNYDFNKLANDKELKQLMINIQDLERGAKFDAVKIGDTDLGLYGNVVKGVQKATSFLQAGAEKITDTISQGTNLELGLRVQDEIDQLGMKSKFQRAVDKTANVISDMLPSIITLGAGFGAGGLVKTTSKGSKLLKYYTLNELINSTIDYYADPKKQDKTIITNAIFDALGAGIAKGIGTAWKGYKVDKAMKALANETIEVNGKKYKVSDILFDRKFQEDIGELTAEKLGIIKAMFDDVGKKLDEASSIDFKRGVLLSFANSIKKYDPQVAKAIEDSLTSNKAVEKLYSDFKRFYSDWYKEFSDTIAKGGKRLEDLNKLGDEIKKINFAAKLEDFFIGDLAKNIKVKGNKIEVSKPEKGTTSLSLDGITQYKLYNKLGLTDKEWNTVLGNAFEYATKQGAKTVKEFKEAVEKYIKTNTKDGQLPKHYQDFLDNVFKHLDNSVIQNIKIKLRKKPFKEGKDVLGKSYGDLVSLLGLQKYYDNPIEFYIVLFHELTHKLGGKELFKKLLGQKDYKRLQNLYKKVKEGFELLKKTADEKTKKEIDAILGTILKNEEEFLTYIVTDMMFSDKYNIFDELVKVLSENGVKFNKKQLEAFKKAIKTYINKRYKVQKPLFSKAVNYLAKLGTAFKEGLEVFNDLFRNIIRTKKFGSFIKLFKETDGKTFKKIVKDVLGSKVASKLGTDNFSRNVAINQITMNLKGENGYKAAYIFTLFTDFFGDLKRLYSHIDNLKTVDGVKKALQSEGIDIVKNWRKFAIQEGIKDPEVEELILKLKQLGDGLIINKLYKKGFSLDDIKKIFPQYDDDTILKFTVNSQFENLGNILRAADDLVAAKGFKDADVLLSYVGKLMTEGKGAELFMLSTSGKLWQNVVKKLGINVSKSISKDNLLKKVIEYVYKQADEYSDTSQILDTVFSKLGVGIDFTSKDGFKKFVKVLKDVRDGKITWTEAKNILKKEGLIQDVKIKPTVDEVTKTIHFLYNVFDHKLANVLAREMIRKLPKEVRAKLYALNSSLFGEKESVLKLLKDDNLANQIERKSIYGLPSDLGAYNVEILGNYAKIYLSDGRTYTVNLITGAIEGRGIKTLKELVSEVGDQNIKRDIKFDYNMNIIKQKKDFVLNMFKKLSKC